MYEDLKTLPEVMYSAEKRFPDHSCLRYRGGEKNQFLSISFKEYTKLVEKLVASFDKLGIKKGDKVGIMADNSYRWIICDMALLSLGAADVPRGTDSTDDEIAYILEHSDASFCIVENASHCTRLLPVLTKNKNISKVFLMYDKKTDITGEIGDLEIYEYETEIADNDGLYEQNKAKFEQIRNSLQPTDIATIIYTSGTTGQPKGVMLSHRNLMHQVHSLTDIMPVRENDRWLSVLPIWHIFERTVEYCAIVTCSGIGYSKPSPRHLLPDMNEIKPTYMVSVPRIWEAVYSGIMGQVKKSSPTKIKLFNFFLKVALSFMRQKRIVLGRVPYFRRGMFIRLPLSYLKALCVMALLAIPNALGQAIVFNSIRNKMGGKLVGPISGGGALPKYIDDFFSAININILEGYGLTETSPVISVRHIKKPVCYTVGKPYHNVEVFIGDNNFNKRNNQQRKGTLYVKGDLVMEGYYKDPEKTAEVLRDGWFNTGDLARLSTKGYIQLLGRAKDTIVLIGGENIEPGPIEDKLLESPFIDQVMVVGQDKKTLGALIIPNKNEVTSFAQSKGLDVSDYTALLQNPEVVKTFEKIVKEKISKKTGFKSFEFVQSFALLDKPFDPVKEVTNSLKLKRNVIIKNYADILEKMFK